MPSASAVFEELIHTAQYQLGKMRGENMVEMEIQAKKKLVRYQKQYGITDEENEITLLQLRELLNMEGGQ